MGQAGGLKTVPQFCDDHSISRSTFYRQVRQGAIKLTKIGDATRVAPEHEAEWLKGLPVVQAA